MHFTNTRFKSSVDLAQAYLLDVWRIVLLFCPPYPVEVDDFGLVADLPDAGVLSSNGTLSFSPHSIFVAANKVR